MEEQLTLESMLANTIQQTIKEAVEKAISGRSLLPADPLEKKLLTAKETASILGVSLPRMYELLRRQDFPGIKISGHHYRVAKDQLYQWIEKEARKE